MTDRDGTPPAPGPDRGATPDPAAPRDAEPPGSEPPSSPGGPALPTPVPPSEPAPSEPEPPPAWPATWTPPPSTPATGPGSWPESPPFSIGALLSDVFARYAEDLVRLLGVIAVPVLLGYAVGLTFDATGAPAAGSSFLGVSTIAIVIGILAGSIMLVLVDGGRTMPLEAAFGRGIRRAGWFIATGLLLALLIGGAILVIGLVVAVVGLAFGTTNATAFRAVLGIVLLLSIPVFIWAVIRLALAPVAAVVDDLGPSAAIRRAWQLTAPAGVWLRLLGAGLLLGLLVAPISAAAGALALPALLGADEPVPPAVAAALQIGAGIITGPLQSLFLVSAYRRLAPPHRAAEEPWAPMGAFRTPRIGTLGRALVGINVGLAIVGFVATMLLVGTLIGQLVRGGLALPGAVAPGTVAFGSSALLGACIVNDQFTTLPPGGGVVWVAAYSTPTTSADVVRVRVTADGREILNEVAPVGEYACVGSDLPEFGLPPATYRFEVYRNGTLDAAGQLEVPLSGVQ